MTKTTDDRAQDQARAQFHSIAAMVAAVDMDWDRLEELRDEREAFEPEGAQDERWEVVYPDDAQELSELEATAGEYKSQDDAQRAIQEDALSLEFRSGWHAYGETMTPAEFQILLCTGGPAVRIVGEIDDNGEPSRAWLEFQDWGTPWSHYYAGEGSEETILRYCSNYVFA